MRLWKPHDPGRSCLRFTIRHHVTNETHSQNDGALAITQVHDEPGVELYALHEGRDRLVMIEKYESEQVRSEHLKGAALAGLRSALDGKLSSNLDAQVLVPHPAGNAQKGAL
jgi:quinol monooxygenase YgiN